MNPMTALYVSTVIAAGALLFVEALPREYPNVVVAVAFSIAMLVVSAFKLRLPLRRGQSTMSMAYVIDFVVLVTAGAGLAMAIAALGVIVQCTLRVRVRQRWYRAAFSVATVAMAVRAAGWTWSAAGGAPTGTGIATSVFALALAAAAYFAINTGLVAGAIALSSGTPVMRCWRQNFLCTAPGYVLAGVAVAVLQPLVSSGRLVLLPAIGVAMLAGYLAYAYWFRQVGERTAAPALT
jgi:hypothetical protein